MVLQHLDVKATSATSFSSEEALPSVSLSAKKMKPLNNDSDCKQNENNVDVTGWILTSYLQQNKNETDNNSNT